MLWNLFSTCDNGHTELIPIPAPTHSFLKRVYPGPGWCNKQALSDNSRHWNKIIEATRHVLTHYCHRWAIDFHISASAGNDGFSSYAISYLLFSTGRVFLVGSTLFPIRLLWTCGGRLFSGQRRLFLINESSLPAITVVADPSPNQISFQPRLPGPTLVFLSSDLNYCRTSRYTPDWNQHRR